MWTLVDPDNAPESSNSRYAGALASRLPELDEPAITSALAVPLKRTSFWRIAGYTTLCMMLAAGLIAQIGYRHLDRISQHQTLRPWLLSLCQIAQCVLPTRQDSSLIVSNRLSIVPHPDFQNVSRLTLGFTNTAGFPQPLPAIELAYTDTRGHEVAGRRFYPRHYLNHSLDQPNAAATTFSMSAGESLTAHLDFANPTADAVNYQVRFVYE